MSVSIVAVLNARTSYVDPIDLQKALEAMRLDLEEQKNKYNGLVDKIEDAATFAALKVAVVASDKVGSLNIKK